MWECGCCGDVGRRRSLVSWGNSEREAGEEEGAGEGGEVLVNT